MRSQRLGDRALRFARPPNVDGAALAAEVQTWPGVVDVALTDAWVGVLFADDAAPRADDARIEALADLAASSSSRAESRAPAAIEIPVRYDGVDLAHVARTCGLDEAHVIELHMRAEYNVRFIGFQPGFAYLEGLAPELHVSRRASPRVRVPKNAVAIAENYAGVYPFDGPGGWQIIGTAIGVELFDLERGALLRAGDRVRFVRVDR